MRPLEFFALSRAILGLLGVRYRQLVLLVLLMLFGLLLELLGLSLVPVFLSSLFWPNQLADMPLPEVLKASILSGDVLTDPVVASLMVGCVFLSKSLVAYIIQLRILRFSLQKAQELKLRLFGLYQALPYSYHLTTSSAEIYQSIYSRSHQIAHTGLTGVLKIVSDGLVITVLAFALLIVTPNLVLMAGATIISVLCLYFVMTREPLKKAGRAANEGPVGMYRAMIAALNGYREIKLIKAASVFYRQAERESQKFIESQFIHSSLTMLPRYLLEAGLVLVMVLWTAIEVEKGAPSTTLIAQVAIFVTAAARLLPLSSSMASSISGLRYAEPSLADLEADLKLDARVDESKSRSPISHLDFKSLKLEQVTFKYEGKRNTLALDGVSVTLERGDRLGIRGESGSGKSTLLNLILGFLTPSSGAVTVNGEVMTLGQERWQSKLAYIPQEVFLFEGTIAENICLKPFQKLTKPEFEHLEVAVESARLKPFIEGVGGGFEAKVGERGVQLSGGQRQRIAIARALFSGREILIMDEATSALDLETERLIIEDLAQASDNVTMIVVGHRPQSLALCDTVLTLDNGRIL